MKPYSLALPQLDWAAIDALIQHKTLHCDSRAIKLGDVFIACAGDDVDGRHYISEAISAGASAVLWQAENFTWPSTWTIPNLPITNLREQLGIIAAHVYRCPSQAMTTIGVTGTNGKTSIAHWLAQAFNALKQQSVIIGTIGNGFLTALQEASLTTPDAIKLQQLLAQYHQQGATHAIMEVSSHALAQGRAHGVVFNTAIFSNLTHDHLNYHGSMHAYGYAKSRLFEWDNLTSAVYNADDPFSQIMAKTGTAAQTLHYGIQQGDVQATHIVSTLAGLTIMVSTPWGSTEINSTMIGQFNVANLLAVLSTLLLHNVSLSDATNVLSQLTPVPGRMQKLGGRNLPLIIVDYAHTPDALEKVLMTIRASMSLGKLYCVFGCGGERDQSKRALMTKAAIDYADETIITTDNPRTEAPEQIIADMIASYADFPFLIETNRASAIALAIEKARQQDVVLIAGKGHEKYQEIAGIKQPFCDVTVAKHCLDRWLP